MKNFWLGIRIVALGTLALATGCTSMSAYQTARVLPEGDFRFTVGGGLFRTPSVSPAEPDKVNFLFLEGGARFGFAPHWDIGLRYTMPGMVTGDLKAEVYEDEAFAFSLGFGVGYLGVTDPSGTKNARFTRELVDILVPVYASYDFTSIFGVYASPRYVMRIAALEQNLLGGALGFRIGNRFGVLVEGGGAEDLTSDYSQYQFGVAFFFGDGPSVPES